MRVNSQSCPESPLSARPCGWKWCTTNNELRTTSGRRVIWVDAHANAGVLETAATGRRQRLHLWARTIAEGHVGWSEGCQTARGFECCTRYLEWLGVPAKPDATFAISGALLIPGGPKLCAPSDIVPPDPADLPRPRAAWPRGGSRREHSACESTALAHSDLLQRANYPGGRGGVGIYHAPAYARWTWSKSRRQYELGSSCECLTAACVKTPQPLSENMLKICSYLVLGREIEI